MAKHVGGQRSGCTTGRRIFDYPVFWREHPRISPGRRRREHEHEHRLWHPILKGLQALKIEPRPIYRFLFLYTNENSRIGSTQKLRRDLEQVTLL